MLYVSFCLTRPFCFVLSHCVDNLHEVVHKSCYHVKDPDCSHVRNTIHTPSMVVGIVVVAVVVVVVVVVGMAFVVEMVLVVVVVAVDMLVEPVVLPVGPDMFVVGK